MDNEFRLTNDALDHDIDVNNWSDVEESTLLQDASFEKNGENSAINVQDKGYGSAFASDDDSYPAHSHHSPIMLEDNKSMDVEKSWPHSIPVNFSEEEGHKLSQHGKSKNCFVKYINS